MLYTTKNKPRDIMIKSKILIGYNQVLCADEILNGKHFSLPLLEDLNRLIEATVLYDKLVLLGEYDSGEGLISEFSKKGIIEIFPTKIFNKIIAEDFFRECFRKNASLVFGDEISTQSEFDIQKIINERNSPSLTDNSFYDKFLRDFPLYSQTSRNENQTNSLISSILTERKYGSGFNYFSRAIIYQTFSEVFGIDYSADYIRSSIVALNFQRSHSSLKQEMFQKFSSEYFEILDDLNRMAKIHSFALPPFIATILDKNPKRSDIAKEILEIRDEFASFRSRYNKIIQEISNITKSMQERLEAFHELEELFMSVNRSTNSNHSLFVSLISNFIPDIVISPTGISLELSLKEILSSLGQIRKQIKTRKNMKAMFDLWGSVKNISDHGKLIQNYFNVTLSKREINAYTSYTKSVRKLLPYE
jgi:hypothetical protein